MFLPQLLLKPLSLLFLHVYASFPPVSQPPVLFCPWLVCYCLASRGTHWIPHEQCSAVVHYSFVFTLLNFHMSTSLVEDYFYFCLCSLVFQSCLAVTFSRPAFLLYKTLTTCISVSPESCTKHPLWRYHTTNSHHSQLWVFLVGSQWGIMSFSAILTPARQSKGLHRGKLDAGNRMIQFVDRCTPSPTGTTCVTEVEVALNCLHTTLTWSGAG